MRVARAAVAAVSAVACSCALCACTPEDASEAADAVVEVAKEAVSDQAPFDFGAIIEPTVLVDNESLRVSAQSLEFKNNQAVFTLEFQNKTPGDLELRTSTNGYAANSVNEYMVSDGWSLIEAPAGQTVSEEVSFRVDGLMLLGIDEVAEVGFGMDVVDAEYREVYRGYASVPTSAAPGHEFDPSSYRNALESAANQGAYGYSLDAFNSEVLYDQGGVSLESVAVLTNKDGERFANLEFANASQSEIRLTVSNVVLDGTVAYEYAWDGVTIVPGKRGFVDLDFGLLAQACDDPESIDPSNVSSCEITLSGTDSNGNTVLMPTTVTVPVPVA